MEQIKRSKFWKQEGADFWDRIQPEFESCFHSRLEDICNSFWIPIKGVGQTINRRLLERWDSFILNKEP